MEGSNFMNLIHPDDKDIVINELNTEDKSVYLAANLNGNYHNILTNLLFIPK